jgi:hypothetical protein
VAADQIADPACRENGVQNGRQPLHVLVVVDQRKIERGVMRVLTLERLQQLIAGEADGRFVGRHRQHGAGNRMAMHDRAGAGKLPVNLAMQQRFRAGVGTGRDRTTVKIDPHDVAG